jgi:hypothetical protein
MKSLAMLGGGALILAVILVAGYYQNPDANNEGYDVQCVQDSQPSTVAPTLTCKMRSEQNTEKGKSKSPWWYKFLAWPEGITAWLLLLTLGAIVWQAKETRKAAEAALLNAQAVINAERAWLVVSIENDPNRRAPFQTFIHVLNNKGRTPAVLKSIHIQYDFVSLPDNLPVPPEYKGLIGMPERLFIVGEKDLPIGIAFDPEKITFMRSKIPQVQNAQEFLVWYGRVTYEDVFETQTKNNLGKVHETRWCYAWSFGDKRFVCCGPGEYNCNT